MKNQRIQIIDVEYTKEEKEVIKESKALSGLVLAKANIPNSQNVSPRENER
jgi:hypothetical protein